MLSVCRSNTSDVILVNLPKVTSSINLGEPVYVVVRVKCCCACDLGLNLEVHLREYVIILPNSRSCQVPFLNPCSLQCNLQPHYVSSFEVH